MQTLTKPRLLGIAAALWCSLGWGATCDFPSVPLTDNNPLYTYTLAIAPVVKGTVKVEYFTDLACAPYQSYSEPITATLDVTALKTHTVYVRLTVTADSSVQPAPASSIAIIRLNPPNAAVIIAPAAPTGFKVT